MWESTRLSCAVSIRSMNTAIRSAPSDSTSTLRSNSSESPALGATSVHSLESWRRCSHPTGSRQEAQHRAQRQRSDVLPHVSHSCGARLVHQVWQAAKTESEFFPRRRRWHASRTTRRTSPNIRGNGPRLPIGADLVCRSTPSSAVPEPLRSFILCTASERAASRRSLGSDRCTVCTR